MTSGRTGCELTLLAVLSVLVVFLFPGVQGPYSVVHGPATALQAVRSAYRLRIAILRPALNAANNLSLPSKAFPAQLPFFGNGPQLSDLSANTAVLRC